MLFRSDGVQDYVREGKLSAGAARALVAVKDARKQRTLAQEDVYKRQALFLCRW